MDSFLPLRKQLGQLLGARRIQLGLTQKEVAALLHVERSVISKMEHGDYNMPIFRVMGYCKEVGLCFSEIIRELESHSL